MEFINFEPKEFLCFIVKNYNKREESSSKNEQYSKATIVISNNDERKIAGFKIKTTTPSNYCVRPSVGKILPNEKAEINIIIKVQKDLRSILSDKFLIQTTVIPEDVSQLSGDLYLKKITEIFKSLERLKKEQPSEAALRLREHKLICDIKDANGERIEGIRQHHSHHNNHASTEQQQQQQNPECYSPNPADASDLPNSPIFKPNVTSVRNRNASTNANLQKDIMTTTINTTTTFDDLIDENLDKIVPNTIQEANNLIKQLEFAIQKYSVEELKNELIQTRRYNQESHLDKSNGDAIKEINEPNELFFEWNDHNAKKNSLLLNKSLKWQIAFLIVIIAFILGAYIF